MAINSKFLFVAGLKLFLQKPQFLYEVLDPGCLAGNRHRKGEHYQQEQEYNAEEQGIYRKLYMKNPG